MPKSRQLKQPKNLKTMRVLADGKMPRAQKQIREPATIGRTAAESGVAGVAKTSSEQSTKKTAAPRATKRSKTKAITE
jgi:hypothetical protein